jgi:hypothetical protein
MRRSRLAHNLPLKTAVIKPACAARRPSFLKEAKAMSLRMERTRREQLQELHSAIVQRTHRRLRDLRVSCVEGQIVIEGICTSYHIVQLALSAIDAATRDLHVPPPTLVVHVNGRLLTLGGKGGKPAVKPRSVARGTEAGCCCC